MANEIKIWLLGVVGTIVMIGLAYAADGRIDSRVQEGINAFQIQTINRELDFYIIKEETSSLTSDDKIRKRILQKQKRDLQNAK
jgi:hypothetical protein